MREIVRIEFPIATATHIAVFEMVATNAAGYAVPFTGASGQTFTGCFAEERRENAGGNGAVHVPTTCGTEEIAVKAGDTPSPGQSAYVDTSTSVTTTAPPNASAAFVGKFLRQSTRYSSKWLVDFRPAYHREPVAVP